ncbi:MAG: NAD(P)/FAD-dependent oxidoreductase [Sporichthyaceae bacterium]
MVAEQSSSAAPEQVDVVVVGARIAGSAAAISFSRAGRRVVVLDAAAFPSDTVSTHVMFAGGMAELKKLGALDRVLAAGAPLCPNLMLSWDGHEVHGTYTPVDGIDFGVNTRRPALDMAMIETARAAGAEVRERCKVTGVLWRGNRVAGLHYTDPDGASRTIEAKLTVGADGRDSVFAEWVGSYRYKALPNGRGLAFHYMTDSEEGAQHYPRRDSICQWRHGLVNSFVFPNNDDSFTALLMPPVEMVERMRRDPEEWDRVVAEQPEMSLRLTGAEKQVKLRSATDTEGYFRISSGPGWALAGDAGSFKDPVIAQGIRDALWSGRTLGNTVAHCLDDPAALDRATRRYEKLRDAEVLATYYWGHKHSRAGEVPTVEREFYYEGQTNPQIGKDLVDTFSRVVSPYKLVSVPREIRWTIRALRRPENDKAEIVKFVAGELKLDLAYVLDRSLIKAGFRPKGTAKKRWHRDSWTGHMALGEHRPSSEPFLPEVEAAPVARPKRGPRPRPAAKADPQPVTSDAPAAASA